MKSLHLGPSKHTTEEGKLSKFVEQTLLQYWLGATSRWYVYARPAKVLACPGRMLSAVLKQAAASLNIRSFR